ncbi:MAG: antibiotic biosynthesis monooxygenase [Nitrososphaerota archaeon]|nr:antibiotic biosynthesis monooxygenase [Nitrososphaerota archaeon]
MSTKGSADDLRYARRVATKVKPDEVENFLSKMRKDVLPILKKQPGIRRIYLLRRSGGENEFESTTFWNKRSDADSYGKSDIFSKNVTSVRDFLESDPTVTEFDVESHDVNAEDLPIPKSAKQVVKRSIRRRSSPPRKSKKGKSS